jgi:uncharacterized membrane protein YdfJ with MMPL/SSD domain
VPPILCFTLLVGLGLDYHIFLLNRVMEYRMQGYCDREAVVLGLASTGGVITAAGLIMAVAFLGTMLAPQPVLYQLSFFIILAVLVDTFIVRAMLVPSMMVTLGEYNWWPRTMPPITRQGPFGGPSSSGSSVGAGGRGGMQTEFFSSGGLSSIPLGLVGKARSESLTAAALLEDDYNTL